MEETWISHNTPESKQQSKQWIMFGESAPKKANTFCRLERLWPLFFWETISLIIRQRTKQLQESIIRHYSAVQMKSWGKIGQDWRRKNDVLKRQCTVPQIKLRIDFVSTVPKKLKRRMRKFLWPSMGILRRKYIFALDQKIENSLDQVHTCQWRKMKNTTFAKCFFTIIMKRPSYLKLIKLLYC